MSAGRKKKPLIARTKRPAAARPVSSARTKRLPASRRRAKKSQALNGEARTVPHTELVAKRDELAARFAELQWDLGGMAYEMASRDHFRLDLIVRQAAALQQVDSELGQAERMLTMAREGAAGACPSCGGLQARGAVFCWQCGKELTAQSTSSAGVAKPASTGVANSTNQGPPAPAEAPTIVSPSRTGGQG